MLILDTGWEIQELDSDLWEVWPKTSMLTLKYNLHPSGLSACEKKLKSPALLLELFFRGLQQQKGVIRNFCRWVQQVLEVLFGSDVATLQRLTIAQWIEWQFTPAVCYPIFHMHTNTTSCYQHTKCIKAYIISDVNSSDCIGFYIICYLDVWTASSLFKHFKEMEGRPCKIQGDSWYTFAHTLLGRHLKLHLYLYKVARSSDTANKGCLFTVSSSTRSRHNLMTLTNGDPKQTQTELVNTLWNSLVSDTLDVKSLCYFRRQLNKIMEEKPPTTMFCSKIPLLAL